MADYGVISDVPTSLVTLLDQDLRKPALHGRAVLNDLPGALWQLRPQGADLGPPGPGTLEAAIRSVART